LYPPEPVITRRELCALDRLKKRVRYAGLTLELSRASVKSSK
jgi:hypothetical protein